MILFHSNLGTSTPFIIYLIGVESCPNHLLPFVLDFCVSDLSVVTCCQVSKMLINLIVCNNRELKQRRFSARDGNRKWNVFFLVWFCSLPWTGKLLFLCLRFDVTNAMASKRSKEAKIQLPVDVRGSKTSVFKFPNTRTITSVGAHRRTDKNFSRRLKLICSNGNLAAGAQRWLFFLLI